MTITLLFYNAVVGGRESLVFTIQIRTPQQRAIENPISNLSRLLDFKVSFTLVISNNSGLLIRSKYNRTPVRILCALDNRGSPAKSDPLSCIAVTATYQLQNSTLETS